MCVNLRYLQYRKEQALRLKEDDAIDALYMVMKWLGAQNYVGAIPGTAFPWFDLHKEDIDRNPTVAPDMIVMCNPAMQRIAAEGTVHEVDVTYPPNLTKVCIALVHI